MSHTRSPLSSWESQEQGKNSRASHSKVKQGLFMKETHSTESVCHLERHKRKQDTELSVFTGVGNDTG